MSAAQYLELERAASAKHELWRGEVFEDHVLVAQTRILVEHYVRQNDGSWRLRALEAGDQLHLAGVAGAILIDDIYRKVPLPTDR
ncbi:hypothetical protein ENSA7_18830 [Enhygromyxa salina]|uniref:Uncharacterized protein n=2 Tax=Enhygromyxa salina TaxID=215803 RepID=A0A2S9YT24_9BACT|nr:hypothetical protein ENSA7_18830 [Enhygromyxa salina]